jgi:hypothetical protein
MYRYAAAPSDVGLAKLKFGALSILEAIPEVLLTTPNLSTELESVLVQHVVPETQSSHSFLKAKVIFVSFLFESNLKYV